MPFLKSQGILRGVFGFEVSLRQKIRKTEKKSDRVQRGLILAPGGFGRDSTNSCF